MRGDCPRRPQRSRNAAFGALFPGGREGRRGAGLGAAPAGGPRSLGGSGIQGGAGGSEDEPGAAQKASAPLHRPGERPAGAAGEGAVGPRVFPEEKPLSAWFPQRGRPGRGGKRCRPLQRRTGRNFAIVPRFPWKEKERRAETGAAGLKRRLCGLQREPGPPGGFSCFLPRVQKEAGSRRGAAVWGRCIAGSRPLGLCNLGRTYLSQGETTTIGPGQVQVGHRGKKSPSLKW